MERLRVLELYSGIGGMHYALRLSGIASDVVAAVDINPNANLVYRHNFGDSKVLQKTIEGIKLDEYNKLDFDMILMSPPCQPFTRQGNQNGSNDNRAQSFLSLIKLIPQLKKKPKYILMENVKGFDQDDARNLFVQMLKDLGYHYQEFLLSPIQFGIPNSRLRYFLIAKLNEPFSFETNSQITSQMPDKARDIVQNLDKRLEFDLESLKSSMKTLDDTEEDLVGVANSYQLNENYQNCCQSEAKNMLTNRVRQLRDFVLDSQSTFENLTLNKETFLKSINLIDIVTLNSTRSNCFTKNYGRYLEGTGSILQVKSSEDQSIKQDTLTINRKSLRFFSPKEIANLHCFPKEFEYPSELTTIQKWRLIGNSLNVFIVSVLIKLLVE